jgi:Rod binding domain-containing protein
MTVTDQPEKPMTTLTTVPVLPPPRPAPVLPDYVRSDAQLREAAVQLEATFLAEMLKSAGFGETANGFGGGIGEEQFNSFMLDAHAQAMAGAGGIGLAESLFEALKVAQDDR